MEGVPEMSIIEAMKDVWRAYRKAAYAYLLAGFLVGVMLTSLVF
jgi:hypothetical protein